MNRRRFRALIALVPALLAGSALAGAPARSLAARPENVASVPVWAPLNAPIESAWSTLALNPASRRGYQLTHAGGGTLITLFDLDTLQPLRSKQVAYQATSLGSDGVDEAGGRLFFRVGKPWLSGIAVLDEAKFAAGATDAVRLFSVPQNPVYSTSVVAGVRFEPRVDKLLILLNPQRTVDGFLGLTRGKGAYANFLAQWNASTGAQDWLHPISQCSTASLNEEAGSSYAPFFSRDGKNIYAICSSSETEVQMLRLGIPSPGAKPTEGQTYPAASQVGQLVIDPVAERVHMIANSSYVVSFDWPTKRIAGTATISPITTSGVLAFGAVDVTTGRLAIAAPPRSSAGRSDPGGLMLIDGRREVLPQALAYEALAGPKLFGSQPPVIDPAGPGRPRRIFIRHSKVDDPNLGEPVFRVIADPVDVSIDPPEGELDPTADVDESESTQSSFASEANGYGSRLLMVGGVQGPVTFFELTGKCGPVNREIIWGAVKRTGLSTVAASARADGADADLTTQADLRDLSRCGNGGTTSGGAAPVVRYPAVPEAARGQGPGWDYRPAECAGVDTNSAGNPGKGWSALTICEQDAAVVKAEAMHVQGAAGGISVGRSTSNTKVFRDPGLGVVAEATSLAENIEIPGVGLIGSVKSVATSRANGRVPKAGDRERTSWTVEICGTTIEAFKQQACRSGPEASEIINRLNEAGRNRVIFRQPAVDEDLISGSPGGYVAGVQRDRGEAALSRLENGDELMVIPGLEIIVRTNPDSSPKRYILQLAGVRAVSTYGIAVLPIGVITDPEAEAVVEELGLNVNATDGFGAGKAVAASLSVPERLVQKVGDAVERLYRTAFKFEWRNPGEVALALGVWLTFGAPVYLADRRRRHQRMGV